MSYPKLTTAELALMAAGDCTRCGTPTRWRDSAGECSPCHNLSYDERKERRKAQLAELPRCEWCTRRAMGIFLGDVRACGRHAKVIQRGTQGAGIFGLGVHFTPAMLRALVH